MLRPPKVFPLKIARNACITLSGIKDILLVGDVGCTGFDEDAQRVLGRLLSEKFDLLFILGDMSLHGEAEEIERLSDFCDKMTTKPIYTLRGNHDVMSYEEFFGSPEYSLSLGETVIIVLDDSHARFEEGTLLFLRKTLAKHKNNRFLIFFHVPPSTDGDRNCIRYAEWQKLKHELDPYRDKIDGIFCGHVHGYDSFLMEGYRIHVTGGGGSALIHELKNVENRIHNGLLLSLTLGKLHKVSLVKA